MKTIYTMTFHWATNYGAVLQAYALQKYLKNQGYDTYIIDYVPHGHQKTFFHSLISRKPKMIYRNLQEYQKERKLVKFRKKYLYMTERFHSHNELKSHSWQDDVFICGSDQIWNPYFTLYGEGGVTTPYYLDFVSRGRKIAYAVSFGVTELPHEMLKVIEPLVNSFECVSVREHASIDMLAPLQVKVSLVCDPVFLLSRDCYEQLLQSLSKNTFSVFRYILHQKQTEAHNIADYVEKKLAIPSTGKVETMSVEEWLAALRGARIVVTNSFHAVAFSIIFHVPFVAILLKESGMNDRITTLLSRVGLENRALLECDTEHLDALLAEQIDWNSVDEFVELMRNQAVEFLQLL